MLTSFAAETRKNKAFGMTRSDTENRHVPVILGPCLCNLDIPVVDGLGGQRRILAPPKPPTWLHAGAITILYPPPAVPFLLTCTSPFLSLPLDYIAAFWD